MKLSNVLLSTFALTIFLALPLAQMKAEIADGEAAVDVLGQLQDLDLAKPVFDTNSAYGGPNSFGFGKSYSYNQSGTFLSTPFVGDYKSTPDVALDKVHNRLFVADSFNNRVLVFNLNEQHQFIDSKADFVLGQPNMHSNDFGLDAQTMAYPISVEYDPVDDRLFVADNSLRESGETANGGRILIFDTETIVNGEAAVNVLGQADFTSRKPALNASKFGSINDLSYDTTSKKLYVADAAYHRVLIFDLTTLTNGEAAANVLGQADFTSNGLGNSLSQLRFPLSVEIDSANNRLFVADYSNSRVLVYDVTTVTDGEAAVNFLNNGMFDSLSSLAYDPTNDRLFTSAPGINTVYVFDTETIVDEESAAYSFSALPLAGGQISGDFDYDSDNERLWLPTSNFGVSYFDVNNAGNGTARVDSIGQLAKGNDSQGVGFMTANAGSHPFGFDNLRSLAVDVSGKRLFVATQDRVLVYELDDSLALKDYEADFVLGQEGVYRGDAQTNDTKDSHFSSVFDIEFDATKDRLYVSDTRDSRVLVFDTTEITNGESAIAVLGQPDLDTTSLNTTFSASNLPDVKTLALDEETQLLYVANFGDPGVRISVFDVNDITNGEDAAFVLGQDDLTSGDRSGVTQNSFSRIEGMAFSNSRSLLFVEDNRRILVFNTESLSNGMNAQNVLGQSDFTSSPSELGTVTASTLGSGNGHLVHDDMQDLLFFQDYWYDDNTDEFLSRILIFDTFEITNGEDAVNVLGVPTLTTGLQSQYVPSSNSLNSTAGIATYTDDAGEGLLWVSDQFRVMVFDTGDEEVVPTPTPTPSASPSPTPTPVKTPTKEEVSEGEEAVKGVKKDGTIDEETKAELESLQKNLEFARENGEFKRKDKKKLRNASRALTRLLKIANSLQGTDKKKKAKRLRKKLRQQKRKTNKALRRAGKVLS